MTLSIIIPHYKEKFDIINKALLSIDNQRLIPFDEIEILIINDCGEGFKQSNFNYKNIKPKLFRTKKNGGAGNTRQFGIEKANGKFIMFIDADDEMHDFHSLFYILSKIHSKPNTDLFWGNFIEEQIFEEQWGLFLHNKDLTFCHGKIYRKEFLQKNNIKFHKKLRYNEDAYFNALVYYNAKKIEYIDKPLINWCFNEKSTVRNGGLYTYSGLSSYVIAMNDLCKQLKERKKAYGVQFLQSLYYIYFQMQDDAWEFAKVKVYKNNVMRELKKFYNNFKDVFEKSGKNERMNLYNDCRKNYAKPICEKQTLYDFINEINGVDIM